MKLEIILSALVALAVAAGGWYYLSSQQAPAPSTAAGLNGSADQGNLGGADTGTPQQPQGDGTDVSQNLILGLNTDTTLGNYLSAYNGMTLYTYAKDGPKTSNCSGDCIANWPPYTVPSTDAIHVPSPSTGIAGQVGTTVRADGRLQVTYNGAPLYFWKNDSRPGIVSGQGIGGAWYVAKP